MFEQLTRRFVEHGCGFWAIVEVCGFNDWLLEMLRNFRCDRIVLVQLEETDRRKTDRRDAAFLRGKDAKVRYLPLPRSTLSALRAI